MRETARNIIVGLTALAGIAGFCALLFLFGQVPEWIRPSYNIKIQFDHAGGLNSVSRVKFDGIDVGRVTELVLLNAPQRGVIAIAKIDNGIRIPKESLASIKAPLLGGSPTLTLETLSLSQEQMKDILPSDGTAQISGTTAEGFAGMGARLERMFDRNIAALRGDLKRALDSFDNIGQDFNKLSSEWTKVGQNVNNLVEPRTLEQVEAGDAKPNVHTVLARADQRLTELRSAIEGLNDLLGDKQLREDIRQTVRNTKSATAKLDSAAQSAKELTVSIKGNADEISKRLFAVADDLSKTLNSAQKLIEKADSGNGTVGRLMSDPALFNNLNDAVERIGAAADEVKLLIQKWKAEGVPVKF